MYVLSASAQVSDGTLAPIVQFADHTQGVYITEGFPQGFQILDGSVPLVQGPDGTSIIQLAAPGQFVSTGDGTYTQVIKRFCVLYAIDELLDVRSKEIIL